MTWKDETSVPRRAAVVAAALLAVACAGLQPARMELPPVLAARPPESVEGIGIGRSGNFALGAERIRFARGRDRLELFETLGFDRATTRYTLTGADGRVQEAACRGRRDSLAVRGVQADVAPFTFECQWRGAGPAGNLRIAVPAQTLGTRAERRGTYRGGGVELAVQSVPRVQGSPLALEQPIGYLLSHRGEPVGAIELNGPTPRLWRPPADDALAEPVTRVALALALLWDPADGVP